MSITPNDQTYTILQVEEFNSYSTFGHHGLIKRGTLEIKRSTRAIPPKIIFFIKLDINTYHRSPQSKIMNPQINSLLLFEFIWNPPTTFISIPQWLDSLIIHQHYEP